MQKEVYKGSFFLGVGAFLSKVIGAVYRIPLLNIITAEGVGLYQMVFPLYCILLDFAGSGAPNAIAKLISGNGNINAEINSYKYLKASLKLLCILGLVFSALMLILSYPLALLQGNSNSFFGYVCLCPAVFLVSIICAFRGYFQGKMNMVPTAVSQIIEQIIKLLFGLLLTYILMPNITLAVGGATLSVTISEMICLLYLYVTYKKQKNNVIKIDIEKEEKKKLYREIIKYTIPFTLVGIMIPLSNFIDSFYIVNILKGYMENATSMYGLFSGAVLTVIGVPVAICYGISVTAIPIISKEKEQDKKIKSVNKVLLLTLVISLVFSVCCFILANFSTDILYRRMPETEKQITAKLIKICSVNVVFLSLLQTQNAIIITMGKKYFPLFSMGIGIIIKSAISIPLLFNEKINIEGVAYGLIACYFFVNIVNLICIKGLLKRCKLKVSKSANT